MATGGRGHDSFLLYADSLFSKKCARRPCYVIAFAPTEARRLIEKIEVVHTPKHGSWLNMAECELSVLEKQALGHRIENESILREGIAAWNADRNHRCKGIDWQFTTSEARIKLISIYPKIQME